MTNYPDEPKDVAGTILNLCFGKISQAKLSRVLRVSICLSFLTLTGGSLFLQAASAGVTVSNPPYGATVAGRIAVVANTSRDMIPGVELWVDGIAFGAGIASPPYNFSFDTTKFANGTHTFYAVARNSAGANVISNFVSANFNNSHPGKPALWGMWSDVVQLPVVSVHAALLPNGVFMSDGMGYGGSAIVWNYHFNTIDNVNAPVNIFCNGMEQTADGRLIVLGGHQAGHVGLTFAGIFNPGNESWTVLPDMAYPRWYPQATTLPDGRTLVTSGEMNGKGDYCPIPEIYNPATNSWSQLNGASFGFNYYYPHTSVMLNGRVIVQASTEQAVVSQALDPGAQRWSIVGLGGAPDGGSSAMYLPTKIIKMGTANDTDDDAGGNTRNSASTAYVLDLGQPSPTWRQTASMTYGRTYHSTTILPNGDVLVTGGGSTTYPTYNYSAPIYFPEIWSPATETWRTMFPNSTPRLYHSIGLLLPDGRVLVSGGGRWPSSDQPTDQLSAEFFYPPYLFQGRRPAMTSFPSQLSYGELFSIRTPDAARIAGVIMMRYGAVTHDFNAGQRYVPCYFNIQNGYLNVQAPPSPNLATPGNYMLFIFDTNHIPSFGTPAIRLGN